MDTTGQSGSRKGRPNYPIDFKLGLAQQACEPGINANMLFKWRRHYRAGLLGAAPSPALMPVTIADAPAASTAGATPAGRIEIAIAGAVVRIEGAADAATVRAVLQGVRS